MSKENVKETQEQATQKENVEVQNKEAKEEVKVQETKEVQNKENNSNKSTLENLMNQEQEKIFLAKKLAQLENENKELKENLNKFDEKLSKILSEQKRQPLGESQSSLEEQEQNSNSSNDPVLEWKKIYELNKRTN